MKNLFILLLLSVSISSAFITENDNFIRTIVKATGDLYENLKSQKIELSIVPPFNIKPKKLYNFVITRGYKSYKIPLNCSKVQHQHLSSLVTCDIDIYKVPIGTYPISSFNYSNIKYMSTASIKIKEVDNKKISDIKLTNLTYKDLKEYQKDSPFRMMFYFSDKIDIEKIAAIKFEDEEKNEYKMQIHCHKEDYDEMKCFGDMIYKAGVYNIIYLQYEKEIIKPSHDLNFILNEDILEIEEARNYYGRDICTDRLNTLLIHFKNFITYIYFTKIIFRNIETNKIYEPSFEFLFDPWSGGSTGLQLLLDFHRIPPGKYYIDFVYKRRLTKTNTILEIKKCEHYDYSELYGN